VNSGMLKLLEYKTIPPIPSANFGGGANNQANKINISS